MPLNPKEVSRVQAARLDMANHVISMVRQRLPFGAGNLETDHVATNGESSRRTNRAYDMYSHAIARLPVAQRGRKPKLMAGIAAKYMAGNCDMAAAMSFTILRQLLGAEWDVLWIAQSGHAYAGFKPSNAENTELTVVDAWPTHGMGTLLEDHFLGDIDHAQSTVKQGKRTEPVRDRITLNAKWNEVAACIDLDLGIRTLNLISLGLDIFPISAFVYSNQLCSETVSHYHTANGTPVANPTQRLLMPGAPIPDADDESIMSDDNGSVASNDSRTSDASYASGNSGGTADSGSTGVSR